MRKMASSAAALILTVLLPAVTAANLQPALRAAREAKPIADLRIRAETVDQTGIAQEAEAVTLRARLGFETGKAWNTSLLAEADLLWPLQDNYNSTTNGKTAFPVIGDPESYELNRLQLVNSSLPDTTIVIGRQRVSLEDQRFIGNVGWRQNEQTFDSIRLTNTSIAKLTVDVAYVDQVNRVFGKESPVGRYNGDNFMMNLSYPTLLGKLVGFAYWLDFDLAPTDSSKTYGLRLTGEKPISELKVGYAVSYGTQSERADNPLDYSADYYALELTGSLAPFTAGVGIELLEGDGSKGFTTPLATLHKFQGWADKFLATPVNGIDDRYVTVGYAHKSLGFLDSLSATAAYHLYESQRLAIDYGSEVNLQLQAKWRRFAAMLKYADYQAKAFGTDTRKLWVQVEYLW